MITVVIPTLGKSPYLKQTLCDFRDANNYESELILIENDGPRWFIDGCDSMRRIRPKKNIGVNPAWNIGVQMATNKDVLIMNDDVQVNWKLFFKFWRTEAISNINYGSIACLLENIAHHPNELNKDSDNVQLKEYPPRGPSLSKPETYVSPHPYRYYQWGAFFAIKKKNWRLIPQELRIWCGDNFIHHHVHYILKLKQYYFSQLKLKGEFGMSSEPLLGLPLNKEGYNWIEIKKSMDNEPWPKSFDQMTSEEQEEQIKRWETS